MRLLHDKGLGQFAAPIRRSIIEHAVNLAAIAPEPEAFDSVIRNFQFSTEKLKQALAVAGLDAGEELEQFLTIETDDSTRGLDAKVHMKHRCDSLGESGHRLYVAWFQETAFSHASFATAGVYLQDTPGDDAPTLALNPQVPPDGWKADMGIADALIMSLDAFSQVMDGDPFRPQVECLNHKRDELLTEVGVIGSTTELDPSPY